MRSLTWICGTSAGSPAETSGSALAALVSIVQAPATVTGTSCILRLFPLHFAGVANLRPLKLHFSLKRGTGEVFVAKRPFKCGGGLCCPLEMDLFSANDGRPIGRVRENFSPYFSKCYAVCCLATMYHDIDVAVPGGGFITKYTLRANLACCGRVNNCCGGTCCKDNAVYDILDTSGLIDMIALCVSG